MQLINADFCSQTKWTSQGGHAAPSLCLWRWITAIHICKTGALNTELLLSHTKKHCISSTAMKFAALNDSEVASLYMFSYKPFNLQKLQDPVARLEHFRGTCIFCKLHTLGVFNQTLQQRILNKEVCCYTSQVFAF